MSSFDPVLWLGKWASALWLSYHYTNIVYLYIKNKDQFKFAAVKNTVRVKQYMQNVGTQQAIKFSSYLLLRFACFIVLPETILNVKNGLDLCLFPATGDAAERSPLNPLNESQERHPEFYKGYETDWAADNQLSVILWSATHLTLPFLLTYFPTSIRIPFCWPSQGHLLETVSTLCSLQPQLLLVYSLSNNLQMTWSLI